MNSELHPQHNKNMHVSCDFQLEDGLKSDIGIYGCNHFSNHAGNFVDFLYFLIYCCFIFTLIINDDKL